MKATNCAFVLLALLALETAIGEQINPVLNYQGYLIDEQGYPYPDGIHNISFAIYDVEAGGTPLWSETQQLDVERGLLYAYLGEVNAFPAGLFEAAPLYLGITYESDPEFEPRHQLAASVYTFFAANSAKLQGFEASHFADQGAIADAISAHGAVPDAHHTKTTDAAELTSGTLDPARLPQIESAQLQDGGVATEDLADDAVTSDKLAPGAVQSEHLSASAFTGEQITDGTLTGDDLADSTIGGDKIAAGSIEAEHLASTSFTGANIVDGSLYSADYADGSISTVDIGPGEVTSYNIADGSITGDDIAANSITGVKITDGSIGNADLGYSTIGTAQIMNGAVYGLDIADNSVTADDLMDEPGIAYTSSAVKFNISTTVQNWMSVTVSAPNSGYIVAWLSCTAEITSGEVAQAGISQNSSTIGDYGEARIVSSAISTGANITIATTTVIPVAAAGNVTVYANVRAAASSSGPVDYENGKLQAIFLTTGY